MAPEQYKGSVDYLNTLNVQQLRGILRSELDEEEVDVELIKRINAVLASKTETRELDIDLAYDRFLHAAANTEPLYSEIMDEMEGEKIISSRQHPKTRHVLRVGMIAAIIAAFLVGASIVAYAMGFNIWGAVATWTEDRFGLLIGGSGNDSLYGQNNVETSYAELSEALYSTGVTVNVVPKYIPSGYSVSSVISKESITGPSVTCVLTNNAREIILNYSLLTEEPMKVFTKDDGDPEIYMESGIEHNIFTNEGSYLTVWINQNVQCEILGVEEKEELLKIIDSIYKE